MGKTTKFKETEIGMIPEDWEVKAIGDVADVIGGGTPSTKDANNFGGDIPWITPIDLSNYQFRYIRKGERNITKEGLENSSAKLLPKETILLTTRAPIGYVAIADNEVTTNQGFRSLIPKKEAISLFLYYLLKLNTEYLKAHSSGTTFGELSGSALKSLKFPFPPISEQTLIAKILSDLDSKVELNCQMNKTLEAIGQAIFKSWFVEFEFPGHEKTKFVNDLPEEWYEGCLADILEISIGGDWGNDNEAEGMVQAISLRGTDLESLKSGGYAPEAPVRWIRKDKLGKRIIRDSDILIGGSGLGPIGKTIYCSRYLNGLYAFPVTYSNFCKRLTAKTPGFAVYVEIILENMYLSGEMNQFYTGTSIPNLDVNSLIKFPVIIPTAGIISKFYEIVAHKFMKLFNKENTLLSQIRDSLLPRLMSGKIRITKRSL